MRDVVGIDCGGTRIKAGLVSTQGEVKKNAVLPTLREQGAESFIQRVEQLVRNLGNSVGAVGIGFAGPLDTQKGIILSPPNFPLAWHHFPVVERLEKQLGIPVILENDAKAASLGEYWQGAGRDIDVLVTMTLGTGIGSGILLGGKIWSGATGAAGEVGHLPLAEDGPLCGCGNRGCLESLASCTAIVRMAEEELRNLTLSTALRDQRSLTAQRVYELAMAGDAVARSIYLKMGENLGRGLACVCHILGPRRIIIGGGGAGAWPIFHSPMFHTLRQHLFPQEAQCLDVCPGQLLETAGLLGAARLALDRITA